MNSILESRRRILKIISVYGVSQSLPEKWSKPVLDSVVLPAHASTTALPTLPELNCEITRGEEGFAPRVFGANFVIDTNIEFFDPEIVVGDTLDARHQVVEADYDETFPSQVTASLDRLFGSGDVPFQVPLPAGVMAGQNLVITVTMTSGALAGRTCDETLDIQ